MKMGIEEPWTLERVPKFIDMLGYREITLNSDTELAIVVVRSAAGMCKAEVTTEDAVKGDKKSRMGSSRMQRCCHVESSEPSSVTSRAARKNHSVTNHLSYRGWWSMQDASCPDVRRVVTGRRHLKDCTARSRQKSSFRLMRKCWQSKSMQIQCTE